MIQHFAVVLPITWFFHLPSNSRSGRNNDLQAIVKRRSLAGFYVFSIRKSNYHRPLPVIAFHSLEYVA
jgi:hypothetical protein